MDLVRRINKDISQNLNRGLSITMFKEVLLYCHVHIYIHATQQYICIYICIDAPKDHFPPPQKLISPVLVKLSRPVPI